ncbi:DUF4238 domain-containing protein [Pseudoxanthomonas wuyuanensis]|uniref:DUF4238 domain-containing protein n=1 Tax=Pseudoxanthomonas wuyuanensis TaxID=1073196 RepID=A0A286DGQ8_9GAMM|nr:DUF4238 domain-containing protein [Pseudoxanthomonas wuyuanensis]SOD57927.1 hypothetical protein SAMN06296416_1211 [Pseudoxanthomonas wuyuanensis]
MAGRKQHYIPRMLLKGFLIKRKGNDTQAWVFKNGEKPYSGSILDIAAKRFFYSDLTADGSKSLDDRITDYEIRLGSLLDQLRNTTDGEQVNSLVAAEVVAHLSIRGAYLREIFSHGVRGLIEGAASLLDDHETTRALLGVDDHEPNSILLTVMDDAIDKIKGTILDGLPMPLLRRLLIFMVREDFNKFYAQTLPGFESMFRQLETAVPTMTREGHAKALNLGLAPDKRVSDLSSLCWRVHRCAENVVLPDCVAIAISEDGLTAQPYLLPDVSRVATIVVPLTSKQVLVGQSLKSTSSYFGHFNKLAASCSSTFFVSSEISYELETLSRLVGGATKEAITDIVSETLRRFDSRRSYKELGGDSYTHESESDGGGDAGQVVCCSMSKVSYRVSFKGCANQEEAEKIAAMVAAIVNDLSSSLDLGHLDEIMFAADYEKQLRELERGFEPATPLDTSSLDGVIGVATSALVVREGKRKSCIVMRSWLGHELISEAESDTHPTAAYVLTSMLSQVAFTAVLESTFLSATKNQESSLWESLFYAPMDGVPMAYYSAWMSADIDPSAGGVYREMVLDTFAQSKKIIEAERIAYATNEDLDRLLKEATSILGALLLLIAKLLGHSDSRGETIFDDEGKLLSTLTDLELCGWIDLFGRDLRRTFSASGNWSSIKELTSLSSHMERHLWRFFIFPWINDEGRVRVEVPYMGSYEPEAEEE